MIKFENYTLSVDQKPLLDALTFNVTGPGLVMVTGASGCGKSTLLKVLTRQIDPRKVDAGAEAPSGWVYSGKAEFDGQAIADWEPVSLRRRIGLVMQDRVMFPGTVRDNLVGVIRRVNGNVKKAEAEQTAETNLAAAGLAEEVDMTTLASALSGGQQQRLMIARALSVDPDILCLDEPTSALDDIATAAVLTSLRRLARAKTLIVVTHDLRLIQASEQILFLGQPVGHGAEGPKAARLLVDGGPEEARKTSEFIRFETAISEALTATI